MDYNNEAVVVLDSLAPGDTKRLKTFYGHEFAISEVDNTSVRLASFKVVDIHYHYRHISFSALQNGVVAHKQAPSNRISSFAPRPTETLETR